MPKTKRPRKIWVNIKKARAMMSVQFNPERVYEARNAEQLDWPMYVDGSLYIMALEGIREALKKPDGAVRFRLEELLIELSEA